MTDSLTVPLPAPAFAAELPDAVHNAGLQRRLTRLQDNPLAGAASSAWIKQEPQR